MRSIKAHIHIHTCIQIYIYIDMYTYIRGERHAYKYRHIHTYIHKGRKRMRRRNEDMRRSSLSLKTVPYKSPNEIRTDKISVYSWNPGRRSAILLLGERFMFSRLCGSLRDWLPWLPTQSRPSAGDKISPRGDDRFQITPKLLIG